MHKNYFKAQSTKEVRQKCLSHCYYVTNHKSDASGNQSLQIGVSEKDEGWVILKQQNLFLCILFATTSILHLNQIVK